MPPSPPLSSIGGGTAWSKPLALTVPDAEALVEKAESAGLVLMVGHLLQYHPAFERLRHLVAEGELGRPAVRVLEPIEPREVPS